MEVQDWIEQHPYLESIARFESLIDQALDDERGADSASALRNLAEKLSKLDLPDAVAQPIVELRDLMRDDKSVAENALEWARGSEDQEYPPVVRLLAWHVLRRRLIKNVESYGEPQCPTCGAAPQLAIIRDGQRTLACALCQTTWPYKRIGCPFCENESPESLKILSVEGDDAHRIDTCDVCKGYTKTFLGSGDAQLFLADWPTLHLDVLARDRGYIRLGASLYDI